MEKLTGHFGYLKNKDLISEYKHIRNKDPSSYNWTPSAKKEIIEEFQRRKKSGQIRSGAGQPRQQTNMFGMPRLSTKGQLPKLFR